MSQDIGRGRTCGMQVRLIVLIGLPPRGAGQRGPLRLLLPRLYSLAGQGLAWTVTVAPVRSWDSHGMSAQRGRPWVAPVLVLLQLAAFVPYLLAGLIAPDGQLAIVRALWVLLSVVAVVAYRRNRLLSLAVPGVTVLTGVALIVLGGAFLGWEG